MTSQLLDDLPAIFRQDPFAGQFLLAFEKLLIGISDTAAYPSAGVPFRPMGLEQAIDQVASYFDPAATPAAFLPWLAGWVGLSLRADLDETKQRDFVARIVQRYRRRGTAGNLADLLSIFTVGRPVVAEDATPFHFTVTIYLPAQASFGGAPADYPAFIDRQTTIAHALIEMEKPAHTTYQLNPVFPSLQIGVHSTVGVDTLLGTATP
jgi:phage tail-like protein